MWASFLSNAHTWHSMVKHMPCCSVPKFDFGLARWGPLLGVQGFTWEAALGEEIPTALTIHPEGGKAFTATMCNLGTNHTFFFLELRGFQTWELPSLKLVKCLVNW